MAIDSKFSLHVEHLSNTVSIILYVWLSLPNQNQSFKYPQIVEITLHCNELSCDVTQKITTCLCLYRSMHVCTCTQKDGHHKHNASGPIYWIGGSIIIKNQLIMMKATTTRDVKTVNFSEPVCRNRFFTGYRKAHCERDNCDRSLRACYQSITCCFTAAVAHIPDARTPSQRNKGQWRIKAAGGRGNRCYAAVS